ncbi:HNH endonuclease signature motif containing protein [Streptomyces sp. NPDC051104]|uniref:HNH endonuclease signature motif containing protein n=1 Tax=Streptomyces sp. NPDC051104 TaxID=3155044 RepID=UPI0034201625
MESSMPSPPRRAVCGECQLEKTAIFKRGLCPTCYERYKRRKRGAKPRSTGLVDPFARVFARTTPGPEGCVIFTGRERGEGYGGVSLGRGREASAHRLAYELLVGPIPDGMTIDHVCHNRSLTCRGGRECLHRRCVNPNHLEPVPTSENTKRAAQRPTATWGRKGGLRGARREDACHRGHPMSPENTVWEKWRAGSDERRPRCRQCLRDNQAALRERRRKAA